MKETSSCIPHPYIFRNIRCENNDRLVTMHTSDHRRSVWYGNQRRRSFQQSTRSFTEEEDEENDDAKLENHV